MGFSTTVVFNNDHVYRIEDGCPDLCNAIKQIGGNGQSVELGSLAQVIETHHRDYLSVIAVGGKGRVLTTCSSDSTDEQVLKSLAKELGFDVYPKGTETMPKNLHSSNRWEVKHFDEIIDFLWENRNKIIKDATDDDGTIGDIFDYPDYGGLPKKLWSHLSPHTVDAIQEAFGDMAVLKLVASKKREKLTASKNKYKFNKRQFARICGKYLYAY